MKRVGNLYSQISAWDNLRAAFHLARRGARRARQAVEFERHLDDNLRTLSRSLQSGSLRLSGYTQFLIKDPKERLITAPAFADRVLHHAVMRVCEPYFESSLVSDTFACRKGKGRLAALNRTTEFTQRFGFFLKLDVRKYFESIPHRILLEALSRKFKDNKLLVLFELLIRSHESRPGCGLPIGSLTSQHFANFYLGHLDRFVKQTLRCPAYVRYMDDFALWANEPRLLREHWLAVEDFLRLHLGLELKEGTHLNAVRHGMNFCGFRIFPGWRELNRRSRRRFAARMAELERLGLAGQTPERELQARADSLVAFAKEGRSWHFRKWALARASTA